MANHWYSAETGEPVYQVKKASGDGTRDTTLADARKLGLVPSVTTILQVPAKPALDIWKQNQVCLAAHVVPVKTGMDFDTWKREVLREAQEIGKAAAEKGHEIHDAIEKYLSGKEISLEASEIAIPAAKYVFDNVGKEGLVSEASFSHPLGFGGRVDLHGDNFVLDFKTKEVVDVTKKLAYDEHCMQLAAYRLGLNKPTAKCYNLFVSSKTPGQIVLHEWKEEEVKRAEEMFLTLLKYWQLQNKLNTSW